MPISAQGMPGTRVRATRLATGAARGISALRPVSRLLRCLCAGLPLWLASGAAAETWNAAGLSFSDAPGGARLLAASGAGTRDDPIVLVEEIIGPGPAVLEIRNGRAGHVQVSPATGFLTLSVVKIIINRGPWRWAGFDLELMTTPDRPSIYSDGLSFDQPRTMPRNARADRFLQVVQEDEPFDRIRFDGGQVGPAEYLRLDFTIVDVNGAAVFYLAQWPIILLAWDSAPTAAPELATYLEPARAERADRAQEPLRGTAARAADQGGLVPGTRLRQGEQVGRVVSPARQGGLR